MVGMRGTSVGEHAPIINAIKKNIIGGVLLFEYNLNPTNTQKNLQTLTNNLQDAATIPLFISIDQEGGKVNRLKTKYGFAPMPSAKEIGNKHSDAFTQKCGETTATALQKSGININFAPVLDVYNPTCPVLGKVDRCYSNNVDTISHIAAIIIDEHTKKGIHTVLKHFPGHGNSLNDSHKGLVDVSKYWSKDELLPYKNLLAENKVHAIMTAHIINKNIDPSGLPATLSKTTITDLLRKTMGYDGVVFSDDMQMHAISSFYGFEQSIKMAINAGVDILIFSNNIDKATNYTPENIHATIKKMVLTQQINMDRINESFQRIMSLKMSR